MANNNNAMTKREVLNTIISTAKEATTSPGGDKKLMSFSPEMLDEIQAYAMNEIVLLDRKAEKSKTTQTKNQKENEELKKVVLAALQRCNAPTTVTDLIRCNVELNGFTSQKVTALLRSMVNDDKTAKKIEEGRKTFYAAA